MKFFTSIILIIILISLHQSSGKISLQKYNRILGSYTEGTLSFFAKIMHIADNAYTPNLLNNKNWKLIGEVKEKTKDGYGYILIHKKENLIAIGIRGTLITSWANIKTDLSASKVKYPLCPTKLDCLVHSGFLAHFQAMKGEMDKLVSKAIKDKPSGKIVVTGHSLGGAVATLYANELKKMYANHILDLVIYGSPRVGNYAFASFTNNLLGVKHIFRVIYANDPIPFLPLVIMGYWHIGDCTYVFDSYSKFKKQAATKDKDTPASMAWKIFHANDHRQYTHLKSKFYRRMLRRAIRRVLRRMRRRRTRRRFIKK